MKKYKYDYYWDDDYNYYWFGSGGNSFWKKYIPPVKNPTYDYDYTSYWLYDKYSWASTYTYVQPDYKKIRSELKVVQQKLNKQWYPIKIDYWVASVSRKHWWVIKTRAESTDEMENIRKFIDKLQWMWITSIGRDDEIMMRLIYSRADYETYWFDDQPPKYILDDRIVYEKYRSEIRQEAGDKEAENISAKSRWGISHWNIWSLNVDNANKVKEELLNKLKIKDVKTEKEESVRKWSRINRKYLLGISHKPLINKLDIRRKKKRVLNIVDSSWSMCELIGKGTRSVFDLASEFSYWIKLTNIFDFVWYYSEDQTIMRMDNEEAIIPSWWEWFNVIDIRLSDMGCNTEDQDYIFVYTDLQIGTNEMDKLEAMLSKKKHIIFNMWWKERDKFKEQYSNLKIVDITSTKDMIANIVNYV